MRVEGDDFVTDVVDDAVGLLDFVPTTPICEKLCRPSNTCTFLEGNGANALTLTLVPLSSINSSIDINIFMVMLMDGNFDG